MWCRCTRLTMMCGVPVFNHIQQMWINTFKNVAKCIVGEHYSCTTLSSCRNMGDDEDFARKPNPV